MFHQFEVRYRVDAASLSQQSQDPTAHLKPSEVDMLLRRFGGASFNDGLYRVMAKETLEWGSAFVAAAFPAFSDRVVTFAFDWLGRIFAADAGRVEGGSPGVVMFEPGTAEALEIPCNLVTFHENELVAYAEEALAAGFHRQWLASGGPVPRYDQCIAYKRPLFLGGKDTLENLEMANLDVYWTLSAQLIQKTRGIPVGTPVKFETEG